MNQLKSIKRVVCGVSGGVDSSVAALFLKSKGYDVVGAFMRNWDGKDETGVCHADKDAEDAEKTCKILDIPFHHVNFVKEYWHYVFENLVADYQAGLTPNPDILCNYHIKFDNFFDFARERLGADLVATGHYASTSNDYKEEFPNLNGVKLMMAKDTFKDQTFFLSHIKQEPLTRTLFPIGKLLKAEIRQIAYERGLNHVASRPDSTGICFIGRRNFQEFIGEYIKDNPGSFVDIDTGERVGEHLGIHMWTLGQRCRIGGCKKPYYVASKDPVTQTIYVAFGHDHPALYSRNLYTGIPHWIHSIPDSLANRGTLDCMFRFQHTKPLTGAQISMTSTGLEVELDKPLRALTPGQYAVFYRDRECLGCARIANKKTV